eukprot:EG_transcript_13802
MQLDGGSAQVNTPKCGVLLQRCGQRQRAIVPHFIVWRDKLRSHTNCPGPGKASTVCRNIHTSKHTHRARLVGELATAVTQFHFFATLLCCHFVLFSKVAKTWRGNERLVSHTQKTHDVQP